jgi:hypothetical protein
MNKIVNISDTMSATLKIGAVLVTSYVIYKVYKTTKKVAKKVDEIGDDASDFVTETINPASEKNFINDSVVGETLRPVFFSIFDFFGVGK